MASGDPNDPEDKPSFIPADYLTAVGRIANAWSHLEFAIDRATWELAAVPHMVGACLTAQMFSMQSKMRAQITLAELRGVSPAKLAALRKFNSDKIGGLQEARNRAVHDTRMVNAATGEVARLQITAQRDLIFEFQPETIDALHSTRKKIEKTIAEYHKLRDALLEEFRSLPAESGRPLKSIHPN